MAVVTFALEDVAIGYMISSFEEIVNDMYKFLAQFGVTIEIDVEEGEQVIDFEAIEEWLRKETDESEQQD